MTGSRNLTRSTPRGVGGYIGDSHLSWDVQTSRIFSDLVVVLVVGLVVGVVVGLVVGMVFGLVVGLVVGLVIGLVVGLVVGRIDFIEFVAFLSIWVKVANVQGESMKIG